MIQVNRLIKENPIILYHGNKDHDMIPKYNFGKSKNDYGMGFYTTPDKELGKEWAYADFTLGHQGFLHTYSLDKNDLNILDLTQMDSLHWIAELFANRTFNIEDKEVLRDNRIKFMKKYKIDTSSYDVIIGYRADDSYFTYAEDFLSGAIYRETIDKALRYGDLGIQVFLKSEKAFLKLVKLGDAEDVPVEYRDFYKKRDSQARSKYAVDKKNQVTREKKTVSDFLRE